MLVEMIKSMHGKSLTLTFKQKRSSGTNAGLVVSINYGFVDFSQGYICIALKCCLDLTLSQSNLHQAVEAFFFGCFLFKLFKQKLYLLIFANFLSQNNNIKKINKILKIPPGCSKIHISCWLSVL